MATINVLAKRPAGLVWNCDVEVNGEVMTLSVRDDADLDRQILARLDAKTRTVTLGVRDVVAPVVKEPDPQTQEEIDRAAFVVLCEDYRNKAAALAAGIAKVAQADVDAAVVAVKTAYVDEYATILARYF